IKVRELYECITQEQNPFKAIPHVAKFWDQLDNTKEGFWVAPNGLYWLCGKKTYASLPPTCKGTHYRSCTLGKIRPSFFLLPQEAGKILGAPL
ncbi:ENR1 protein, partial [Machaerirhynchus nigripectus]|nr:ENR1 protein [Machaerirhynchus nigripectus]